MTFEGLELREAKRDDGSDVLRFRGHASVFDQETDLFWFREKIAPGAFAKTLKDKADVRFLYNHNPDSVMARTTNGTLTLSEDDEGLLTEADLDPDDLDVQRLAPKLRSGNVNQMSFGFQVVQEEMEDEDEDKPLRIVREAKLFDVSSVTFPAYEGATGELNSAVEVLKRHADSMGLALRIGAEPLSMEQMLEAIAKVSPDEGEEYDADTLRAAIDALEHLCQPVAVTPEGEPIDAPLSLADAKRRLALAEGLAAIA